MAGKLPHLLSQLEGEVLKQGGHGRYQGHLGERLTHTVAGALCEGEVALRPPAVACTVQ